MGDKKAVVEPASEKQDVEMVEMVDSASDRGAKTDSLRDRLRVNVDGNEDDAPFKLNARLVMALVGCSFAFAGSQLIPLSFFTLYTFIAKDFGETNFVWLKAANWTGQIGAACTLGPLSDLLGRKPMFMAGISLSMLGMIVCASTPTASGFIAGQALAGFGLMAEELLALAVTAELVPTSKRAVYGAAMIAGFIPWAPGALYAQLIAMYNWRWIGCMIAIWHLLALAMIAGFYKPPPRVAHQSESRKEIIQKIDIVGIALGITGFVVFLVGLNWGGQTYPWASVQVGCALGFGLFTVILFICWEMFGAKYPLFPRRLVQVKSTFWAIMLVIFAAGINYVPLAIFWPIESISVFNSNHKETGLNTVPVGLCILGGAIISAGFCGKWPQHCRLIMTFFCIMQTAGVGAMAAIDPHNINTAWPPLIIGLVGVGGVLFPNQIIVTVITPDDLLATVTSLTFVIRGVSQSVALALLQNRFVAAVTANALKLVAPAAIKAGLTSVPQITELVNSLTAVPFKEYVPQMLPMVNTTEKYDMLFEATVQTFGKSFPTLYYIGLGFGIVGCIASILVGDMSKYMDEHVAVHIH
ncbi:MFS general substrate transporter [Eremomyces bilateralis CBS 781.70]|uniref:MFS general substrate transporter n=1 Tax=Eremomyces bilateralis CBS 781.70 TaxID=1392243 RepID=A0A6G1G9L7_9PEZI|nr:MFS general substrate transporter [Eremomyces bilateralis CBS 781.70]KAF1814600.1 MFS general substrate transporter [Eremomyces bilateralis CBS 781.70]